ncbi:MAG: amino acid adenylation domain-containing protein [Pseudonocardia sp.]
MRINVENSGVVTPLGAPTDLVNAFGRQARRQPDKVAVSARDGVLSYREMDERSAAIAQRLVAAGCRPGAVVALLTERTTALPVGILAILKAGAAYLPLDPRHAGERTAKLISSAGCRLLLTSTPLLQQARTRADTGRLNTQLLDDEHDEPDLGVQLPDRNGSSLAYVLPTSGSTGRPKGVQIMDRNVLGLVTALDGAVLDPLGDDLRVAMVALHVFDASVQQMFLSLVLGHTLLVVPEQTRADGVLLRRFWADEQVDVSDGTPAHLRMTTTVAGEPPVNVRRFLIGGDVLSADVARRFLAECSAETKVINVYGVAECCVDATAAVADPAEQLDSVPIGRPLPGAEVDLLDSWGRSVEDGEVGEIHLGGFGVGLGYIGRRELTEERFLPHPHDGDRRRYRTGDLARRLADGRLQFLGRADRQFKLRGQRIEPGEIESALRGYSSRSTATPESCSRCLLTSAYPSVTVTEGLCSVCRRFDEYRDDVQDYFGDVEDLRRGIAENSTRKRSGYDVLLLFSGGKDSTYALYRLLDLGLRVLAFTFDNGYISPAAFNNIRRIIEQTGVDLEIGSTAAMDDVFAESLRNDSTVCSGCFRGLTAMSTKLAAVRGIGVVVTGLSRGQIFDTKLRLLVESGVRDPREIDEHLMVHRTLYHARQDRTTDLLAIPLADEQWKDILFLDYFRYDQATTTQVKEFLISRDELWAAPTDTGMCSTNCRINEVGIYVHSIERGYHNYASPLSWDCRLGVLSREQGVRELIAVAPREHITSTLRRLGYTPRKPDTAVTDAVVTVGRSSSGEPQIWAYYAAAGEVTELDLREHLTTRLPEHFVPGRFIRLDALPMTDTGKIDFDALPEPGAIRAGASRSDEQPTTETETRLSEIWAEVLGQEQVGRNNDFFSIGGDSLTATIVAGLVEAEFAVSIPVADLFTFPTIAGAASQLDVAIDSASRGGGHRTPAEPDGNGLVPEPERLHSTSSHPTTRAAAPVTFLCADVWGGVDGYRELALGLPGQVWGLPGPDLPARVNDIGIDPICRLWAERIRARWPRVPYQLGGWSFGAVIALGVSHHLARRGGTVEQLVIIDAGRHDADYWLGEADRWRTFLGGDHDAAVPLELRRLIRPGAPTDRATLRTHASAILPVLQALGTHRAEPAEVGLLTHVRPADSRVDDHDFAWWRQIAAGKFATATVPGDHFTMLSPPGVRSLAGCFRPLMAKPGALRTAVRVPRTANET